MPMVTVENGLVKTEKSILRSVKRLSHETKVFLKLKIKSVPSENALL
jgi:hypothetical protein